MAGELMPPASTQKRAQEIDIPLPTSGLFVDAKTGGKTSPIYAATLENFRTDGITLQLRRQSVLGTEDELALQRVPYVFGPNPRYIELQSTQANCAGASFARQFNGKAMIAYLSSQAIMVDGLDLPLRYDGTTFQYALYTTTTGTTVQSFDGIIAHHDRPFLWKTDGALEFYYGDVGAVMGELTRFPLDRLGNITGNMVAAIGVTVDAGENINDALAIYTSTGQIVIYEGLDPGDANDWALSTRIQIAPPLSRFTFTRVGGDVWVLTAKGLVSIRDTVQQGSLALVGDLGRPISDEILELVNRPIENDLLTTLPIIPEWQLHTSADGSQVIINYYTPNEQRQFIWETNSRAWETANFPARYWHNLVLSTEFTTGTGRLGQSIDTKGGTEEITAAWHTGWFTAGGGRTVAYVKPTIKANGPLTIKVTVLRDYNETPADIAEAEQIVVIEPERVNPGQIIALSDEIPVGVAGDAFQLRIEVTATWAEIVAMMVAVE
jgi:hypothetical protein